MKTIYHHRVEFGDGKGICKTDEKFEVNELEVIGENDICLVVNNRHFTTVYLDAEKHSINYHLEKPSISIYCSDRVFGSAVWYTMYSRERLSATNIRKQIRAAIDKKVGFFMDKIDLSFIKDAK